jgi:hypothetical protein
MALPVALAAASAGLSVLGGIAGNKAITQAATAQYEANKLFIERDSSVKQNLLQIQAGEVNNELGMALSALSQEVNRVRATSRSNTAESMVFGNLAARKEAVISMKEALQADALEQAAEANMVDFQVEMTNQKYATEAQHAQNMQDYSNMMSKRKSTLSIVADGLSAAASGYSMGQGMQLASAKLDSLKSTQSALQGFKPR